MKKPLLTALLLATLVQPTIAKTVTPTPNTPSEMELIKASKYDHFTTPYGTFNAYAETPQNSREYLKTINFEQTLAKAKTGDAVAQFQIGKMYDLGIQVKKDTKQAFDWYSKSAEQGNNNAKNNLAGMYLTGNENVKSDPKKAIELWTQASKTVPSAKLNLVLNGDQDNKTVMTTLEQLSNENFLPAQFTLGTIYYYLGNPDDRKKGFELIKKSADGGLVDAQNFLVQAYMGRLATLDVNERIYNAEQAQYWAKRGCKNEHPIACQYQEYFKELPVILEEIQKDLEKRQTQE